MIKHLMLLGGLLLTACDADSDAGIPKDYMPCSVEERGPLPDGGGIAFISNGGDHISYCLTQLSGNVLARNVYEGSYVVEIFNSGYTAEKILLRLQFPDFSEARIIRESIKGRKVLNGLQYSLEVPPSKDHGYLLYVYVRLSFAMATQSNGISPLFFMMTRPRGLR